MPNKKMVVTPGIIEGGKRQSILNFELGKQLATFDYCIIVGETNKKALNINLVTPTHYVPQIIEAIKIAKGKGLKIPIVYNSNGYESIETLKKLEGYIDVYLPDLKYYYEELGKRLSGITARHHSSDRISKSTDCQTNQHYHNVITLGDWQIVGRTQTR